jgi:hypothetical protein
MARGPYKTIYDITRFLSENKYTPKQSYKLLSKIAPKLFPKQQAPKIIAKVSFGSAPQVQLYNVPQLQNVAQVQSSAVAVNQLLKPKQSQGSITKQQSRQQLVVRQNQRVNQAFAVAQVSQSLVTQRQDSAFTPQMRTQQRTQQRVDTNPLTLPRLTTPTPTVQVPILRQRNPLSTPNISRTQPEGTRETKKPFLHVMFKIKSQPSSVKNLYSVQVRRFGKFKTIGVGDLGKVFDVGRKRVTNTLGATFKVTGNGKLPTTPQGFYRKGNLFIEKRKFRLSTSGEVKEIQTYKKKRRIKK